MDRYNYLKKLFNMSEQTYKHTVPLWYAQLKSNRNWNRIMSNAICNPNSNVIKAMLFSNFKIPLTNNYDNIVSIFKAILKEPNASNEKIAYRVSDQSGCSTIPSSPNRNITSADRVSGMNIELDEWWGERTEVWRVSEHRYQRSNDSPSLNLQTVLDKMIEDANVGSEDISELEEYVREVAEDPDDYATYDTHDSEHVDDDFDETINTETGFNFLGTMQCVLEQLQYARDNNGESSQAINSYIAQESNNRADINTLISMLESNL